jgi:hypothetical protein
MGSAHNPVAASNGGKCTVSCVRESSSVRNLATPQPAAFLASHEDALALAIYCSPSEALTGCTYAGAQALYIAEAVRGWVARSGARIHSPGHLLKPEDAGCGEIRCYREGTVLLFNKRASGSIVE